MTVTTKRLSDLEVPLICRPRARLDPSGDSPPKTRLLGHVVCGDEGTCVAGPGDTWENVETGERIDLTVNRQAILDRSGRAIGNGA